MYDPVQLAIVITEEQTAEHMHNYDMDIIVEKGENKCVSVVLSKLNSWHK